MLKKTKLRLLFVFFTAIAVVFAIHAYINKTEWFSDQFLAVSLLLIGLIFHKKLKLNPYLYFILALSITIHDAGTFGFYNISPVSIQYDHITHFFALFSLTLFFYNYFYKKAEFNILEISIISLLIAMGIGALIEIWEFIGHITRTNFFAGLTLDKTDQGREWVNSMIDLLYNGAGCLAAILIKQFKRMINKLN